MAQYPPPKENNSIFDTTDFIHEAGGITGSFLEFPTAQGKETLQEIDVLGNANFSNPIVMTGATSSNRSITNSNYFVKDITTNTIDANMYSNGGDLTHVFTKTGGSHFFISNYLGTIYPLFKIAQDGSYTFGNMTFIGSDGNRSIRSSNYVISDIFSANPTVEKSQIYGLGTSTIFDNTINSGDYKFQFRNSVGTLKADTFIMNYDLMTSKIPLTITDGTNTNTLNSTTWTGTAATATTATTATNITATSDNTNTNCYLTFTKTVGATNAVYVDDVTSPLTYNPSTGILGTQAMKFSYTVPYTPGASQLGQIITSGNVAVNVASVAITSTSTLSITSILLDVGTWQVSVCAFVKCAPSFSFNITGAAFGISSSLNSYTHFQDAGGLAIPCIDTWYVGATGLNLPNTYNIGNVGLPVSQFSSPVLIKTAGARVYGNASVNHNGGATNAQVNFCLSAIRIA